MPIRRLSIVLAAATVVAGQVGAASWPQEIATPQGTIVVYQPQPETLDGDTLQGRAAMALELTDRAEPVFGVFWFSGRLTTDSDAGTAELHDIRINDVRWPESTEEGQQRFTELVEAALPETGFATSLEALSASLADAEATRQSLLELKSDPPVIAFREELAVLLMYDGQPRFADIDETRYERALNTPFAVVRDKRRGDLWLAGGSFWYEAEDPLGPWKPTDSPPKDLLERMPKPDPDAANPTTPPAIVVATEPTELIVTIGPPQFKTLPGGELLYVHNTETPWLREVETGAMYVLLSGRWFRASSQSGPWTFVRADRLPDSFKRIPPASDIGGVRVSVAGTEEADDALLDAQIPQTAAIRRSEAKLEVQYDGAPRFEAIPGTNVAYAVNTGAQVLMIHGRYYACDNGVWFTAPTAEGPWTVADSIPEDEIQKIPPSSPVYNTTHVHIYESTPEVVYVGYTPGYMWSFPYYGVPVYGTGWIYPPYYGWYYPRPPTWGLHVGYNPWTGWNVGLSWTNGFFTVGIIWSDWGSHYPAYPCCGGWYGGGYRPPYVSHHGDINIGEINIGNTVNAGNRAAVADRMSTSAGTADIGTNIYNRPENRARNADAATAARSLREARPAAARSNDVFADPSGNVARRNGDAWEVRQNGEWSRASSTASRSSTTERIGSTPRSTTPSPQPTRAQTTARNTQRATTPSYSVDQSSLNRSYASRQHGASREGMSGPARAPMARPRGGRR